MSEFLTWRENKTGELRAAYRGRVRVGYVQFAPGSRWRDTPDTWLWTMNLLKPEGGAYCGRVDTVEDAMFMAEEAIRLWLEQAELLTDDECEARVREATMEDADAV